MELIGMIILGLVAGALAKRIMPGRDGGGVVWTLLLGIAGSLVGGFLFNALGIGDGERWAGLIGSSFGAIVILGIYRMLTRRGRRVAA